MIVERRYPTNVLVTGFDIIFFWVARMIMIGLHFMGDVPFKTVYLHALIRDEYGAKMSKSKGNVIDPLDWIDTYGADALRFTLAILSSQGRDIKLAKDRAETSRHFLTKIWNAVRFAEMNGCMDVSPFLQEENPTHLLNQWIFASFDKTLLSVTDSINAYQFNEAALELYRFFWNVFCDWYLELSKPLLIDGSSIFREEIQKTVATIIDNFIKIAHPFMPFITEEIWHLIKERDAKPVKR